MDSIKKKSVIGKKYPLFSVSMCVYAGDDAKYFDAALASIVYQTVQPAEIVLVVDGPVCNSIFETIKKYEQICKCEHIVFQIIKFEINRGHGYARRNGLEKCTYDIVALMDADDISKNDRFEKELNILLSEDVDIVGSDIAEFIEKIDNVVGYRKVYVEDEKIKEDIKKRCPFNQQTVMMKKSVYEKAGGYIDWYCEEDYYLWLRMMQIGARFANTGSVLVFVRVGSEMYQRRGGLCYFQSEVRLQKYMLNRKIIKIPRYVTNCLKRFIVQILLPNEIRGWVFQKFARKRK